MRIPALSFCFDIYGFLSEVKKCFWLCCKKKVSNTVLIALLVTLLDLYRFNDTIEADI